ncbi:hypothetical protein DFH07DRAFT_941740, partial [Mycena maculata]
MSFDFSSLGGFVAQLTGQGSDVPPEHHNAIRDAHAELIKSGPIDHSDTATLSATHRQLYDNEGNLKSVDPSTLMVQNKDGEPEVPDAVGGAIAAQAMQFFASQNPGGGSSTEDVQAQVMKFAMGHVTELVGTSGILDQVGGSGLQGMMMKKVAMSVLQSNVQGLVSGGGGGGGGGISSMVRRCTLRFNTEAQLPLVFNVVGN